jgi:hypothetical protein
MRFTDAKVREAFERSALKLAVICLSVTSLTFGVLLVMDASQAPIVIDRACESKILGISSSMQTPEEIQDFVKVAMILRFDSDVARDPSAYMTEDLYLTRMKEQDELNKRSISQHLIIRKIHLDKNQFTVEADRLVAVGQARSAIPLVLRGRISAKSRSLTNPYGLVLSQIERDKEVKSE